MPDPLRVEVRPAQADDVPVLLAFTRSYYGQGAHQSNPQRLEWLLHRSPLQQGLAGGLLLAVCDGQVVGSHWKMRIPMRIGAEPVIAASPHDLALAEPYRKVSAPNSPIPPGLQLALGVLRSERYAALLGLSPASEAIYSRHRCNTVAMVRMRKVLSPVRVAAGMVWHSCGRRTRTGALPAGTLTWQHRGMRIEVNAHPSDAMLREALAPAYRGECHLNWDVPWFRWRFFHPLGPKHVLLTMSSGGAVVARAVFSYGLRRGAVMSRLVDAAADQISLYPPLLESVERAMGHLKVAVATTATTCAPAWEFLQGRGWQVQHGVTSRFYTRPERKLDMSDLWGGAYDYGFDAMPSSGS